MNLTLLNIIFLSFVGDVVGFLGGLILIWNEKLTKKYSIYLISFAAGVILAIAFLDVLPEAYKAGGESAFTLALIGMVAFYLIENFILHLHHHEGDEHPLDATVPLILVSDAIHNFIDGVAIAIAYMASPKLGVVVALATLFHEIPKETGDFSVLLASGLSKAKAIGFNLLTAVVAMVGAVATYYLAGTTQKLTAPLLGIAAGMFLYIASSDILPQLTHGHERKLRWVISSFFLAGIVLIVILTRAIPE
jgi:zinc and cadmium transporter